MIDQSVRTFVTVVEVGSFTKAAGVLYITPTAVMNQINQLEARVGAPLLDRTNQGVACTAAGKSLYKDATKLIEASRDAIGRAIRVQMKSGLVIRVGTSVLYPAGELMERWDDVGGQFPDVKLRLVPFEDTTRCVSTLIDSKIDVLVGPFGNDQREGCGFLELGRHGFAIAVPKADDLALLDQVTYADLHGRSLMMMRAGNSPDNDLIRRDIESEHPQITLLRLPSTMMSKCSIAAMRRAFHF